MWIFISREKRDRDGRHARHRPCDRQASGSRGMRCGALCAPPRRGRRDGRRARRPGRQELGSTVDVSDIAALRSWVPEAEQALGGLDIFVANVSALAQSMDDASWRRSWEIDIMGTVAGVEAAISLLEISKAGAIVVVGTTGAIEIAGPPAPMPRRKRRWYPMSRRSPATSPARISAPIWCRPATSILRAGSGIPSNRTTQHFFRRCCHATRWAEWAPPRGRERGRVPREPASELHHRHQPDYRRRIDPACAVLIWRAYPMSFFSLSAICSGALSWVKLAVKRPSGSIT